MTTLQNISQIAETSEYPSRNRENGLTCLGAVIVPLGLTFTPLDWPIGPVLIRPFAIKDEHLVHDLERTGLNDHRVWPLRWPAFLSPEI